MKIMDKNGTWDYPPWFFSLARFNPGGPTWYGNVNRLAADMYFQRSVMGIVSAGLTFLLVLFVILPIIKHKLQSVIVAVNAILVGVAVSLCLVSPEWVRGHGVIQSPLYYHSPESFEMTLGVHVGLAGFNATLKTVERYVDVLFDGRLKDVPGNLTRTPKIFYNEHVKLYHPDGLETVMVDALRKGLPDPLLTVYNCLTSSTMGFDWSHRILEAGYHCYLITVFALVGWFLVQIFIAAIPHYSAYGYIIVGYMMIFNTVVYFYWSTIYKAQACIVISDTYIELTYGICFWTSLVTGVWSCIYGFIMTVFDTIHPDKFLTIFDLDYDHKRALATAHRLNHLPHADEEKLEVVDEMGNDVFVQMKFMA